jgi:hypothetical protein
MPLIACRLGARTLGQGAALTKMMTVIRANDWVEASMIVTAVKVKQ